ncbi:MAG: DUF1311 domain-containing protein [Sulfuritalea sp.]|nr:DUF1311 domain-containing protein [Sulfuritalea sp.]
MPTCSSTSYRHHAILLFLPIAIMAALTQLSIARAAEPSFSCSKAKSPVEKAICDSEALSKLDKELANTYEPLKEAFVILGEKYSQDEPSHASIIVEQQRDWIRLRDRRCNANRDIIKCIQTMTQERIAVLGGGTKPTYLARIFHESRSAESP